MTKPILAAAAALLLSGCAGAPDTEEMTAESDQICTYERETGSHRRTKVCRTPAQVEAEREQAWKTLNDMDEGSIAIGSE